MLFKITITRSRNIWIRHDLQEGKRTHKPWLEKKLNICRFLYDAICLNITISLNWNRMPKLANFSNITKINSNKISRNTYQGKK